MTQKVLNPRTNRFVKVGTQKYNRLVAEGVITLKQVETPKQVEPKEQPEPEKPAPYDERRLKTTLADITTDMVKENMKEIVKAQTLSDEQMDAMMRKMLYRKLCVEPPKPKKPAKKGGNRWKGKKSK